MIIDTFVHFYILIISFETVPKGMKQTLVQTLKIYYIKYGCLCTAVLRLQLSDNITFYFSHYTHTTLNPLKSSHSKTALMYMSQSLLGVLILGQNLEGVHRSTQASTAHVFCCHCINNMKFLNSFNSFKFLLVIVFIALTMTKSDYIHTESLFPFAS